MFRSLVNWLKQAVINTAFAELSAELESSGAMPADPPMLTLDVESGPVSVKAKGRKTAKK